jgi:hypothetical protein
MTTMAEFGYVFEIDYSYVYGCGGYLKTELECGIIYQPDTEAISQLDYFMRRESPK